MTDETPTAGLRWQSYTLPKSGNRVDEFEDALAGDSSTGRFAVADGVTETICSDVWAKLLVEGFKSAPPSDPKEWLSWLTPLRSQWWDQAPQRTLPWYAEHKLAAGAAATLLGLVIQPDQTWNAIAVGDSCLFQIREEELIKAFPKTQSFDFNNRPNVMAARHSQAEDNPLQAAGTLQPGDKLLLTTDAIAEWFLSQYEIRHKPLSIVQQLFDLHDKPYEQEAEIVVLRDSHHLRDDDVSLLLIEA